MVEITVDDLLSNPERYLNEKLTVYGTLLVDLQGAYLAGERVQDVIHIAGDEFWLKLNELGTGMRLGGEYGLSAKCVVVGKFSRESDRICLKELETMKFYVTHGFDKPIEDKYEIDTLELIEPSLEQVVHLRVELNRQMSDIAAASTRDSAEKDAWNISKLARQDRRLGRRLERARENGNQIDVRELEELLMGSRLSDATERRNEVLTQLQQESIDEPWKQQLIFALE